MPQLIHLLFSIATLSIVVGGLAWSVGREGFAQRALAFGIVLAIVRHALVLHGVLLAAWFRSHGRTLVLAGVAVVGVVAVGRVLRGRAAHRDDGQKPARKKRVGRGP